jgi:nitroreductase
MLHTADIDTTSLPEASQWAQALIQSRRTTLPKRLIEPGPNAAQQDAMLLAAAAAPDHERLTPWRFIEVPTTQRARLAEVFDQALRERDAQATDAERAQAREKAYRSPWLLLAVARLRGGDDAVPASERLVSAGCAIQNLLLMATALGFGSALTSGKAMQTAALRQLFGLADGEEAVCFVNIGTIKEQRPLHKRPAVTDYFSRLDISE